MSDAPLKDRLKAPTESLATLTELRIESVRHIEELEAQIAEKGSALDAATAELEMLRKPRTAPVMPPVTEIAAELRQYLGDVPGIASAARAVIALFKAHLVKGGAQ